MQKQTTDFQTNTMM